MKAVFHSLLLLFAKATDRELARMLQFLKAENSILRAKLPRRVEVTPPERRRLIKFGKPLGTKLRDLITIVSPRTFLRWLHAESPTAKAKARDPGRPRTDTEICDLILRIAQDTGWGYTRILGELK